MTGDTKTLLKSAAGNSISILGYLSTAATFFPIGDLLRPYVRTGGLVLIIVGVFRGAQSSSRGRTRRLHKLMVVIQYDQPFDTIGRRHVYEQGRFTIEIEPHDLPVFQTVRVKLTNANTGDFLYEGEFRITPNPLGIVAEVL
jgi:hypothetical protein